MSIDLIEALRDRERKVSAYFHQTRFREWFKPQDLQDAVKAGLTGTPFFVVSYNANGQVKTETIDGAQPFSVFQKTLDAALVAAGAQ